MNAGLSVCAPSGDRGADGGLREEPEGGAEEPAEEGTVGGGHPTAA